MTEGESGTYIGSLYENFIRLGGNETLPRGQKFCRGDGAH